MEADTYREIQCRTALNRLQRKIPYGWDLNIYRGCEHGCRYCYAMYSHDFLDPSLSFQNVHVKVNVVERLEQELRSPNWHRDIVNIGGVTDSYQPAEAQYKLMPEILKLLIRYQTPAIISTKSDLILRDYYLIDQLSRLTYINIAATITTVDENLRSVLEPGAVASQRRFEMLKAFRQTNASVGLHVMPIIPLLTDHYQNIDGLFQVAKDCGVHYVLPGTLYLRGRTKKAFLTFMGETFSSRYSDFLALYKTGGADKAYKDRLYKMVNERRGFHALSSSWSKPMKEKLKQKAPNSALF